MNELVSRRYEFGSFALDPGKRLLLREGEPVPLAPKVLEILQLLIENRGRVLTKDELLEQVWNDTIGGGGGLTRNVSILRKALGERPDEHQYIVTVPGRGYQFVADVHERRDNEKRSGVDEPADLVRELQPKRAFLARRWLILSGLVVSGVAIIAYLLVPHQVNTARPEIKSIAVLPLQNLSGDPAQEYFADGMTEALISSLAQIRALRVISRTSVMSFKGIQKPLPEIARELKVDGVIEGSVQRENGRLKIMIQLIHGPTDAHLWARDYERELTDVLKLQGELAHAIAQEIRIQVTPEEGARLASATTVNPAAHQEYLIGRYHLWRYNEEDLKRAIDYFERAIQIDPKYAAAYAGLSHAWWARGIFGRIGFREAQSPSRAAARKALELDDRLAEAYVVQADVKSLYDWDWTGAEDSVKRALELDPNNLDAHHTYAILTSRARTFP